MLVYPYLSNGTVASFLRGKRYRNLLDSKPPLDWPKRKQIAEGSARGLAYLHDQCNSKIIHRDVKVSHIFLNDDFETVLGDFGLAMFMYHNDTHVTKDVRGTVGLRAPEYLYTSNCSEKSDVFGYGLMLFELITGQRAFEFVRLANDDDLDIDWTEEDHMKKLFYGKKLETFVDVDLQGNYIDEEVEQLVQVALICTEMGWDFSEHPKMSEVVRMLEGDGLADRWKEFQKRNSDQIISYSTSDYYHTGYSSDDPEKEEFSEPR